MSIRQNLFYHFTNIQAVFLCIYSISIAIFSHSFTFQAYPRIQIHPILVRQIQSGRILFQNLLDTHPRPEYPTSHRTKQKRHHRPHRSAMPFPFTIWKFPYSPKAFPFPRQTGCRESVRSHQWKPGQLE